MTRAAKRFIAKHLDSVGALDLLLLVHGARDRSWSLAELCEALQCPEAWAQSQLGRLARLGLLVEVAPDRVQYRRADDHGLAVDQVAHACRRSRSAVIRHIFAVAPRPGAARHEPLKPDAR